MSSLYVRGRRLREMENEAEAQRAKAAALEAALAQIAFWPPGSGEEAAGIAGRGLAAARDAYRQVVLDGSR